MTPLAFLHPYILLDACCAINLYESGVMGELLKALPLSVAVTTNVSEELMDCDLQPLVETGLVILVSPTDDEAVTYVQLAVQLGDGEAATGAIAKHRSWAIATDDRKAARVFAQAMPHLQLVSTPELIKYWVDQANPSPELIRNVLEKVELEARYKPAPTHPLYRWWQTHCGRGESTPGE